MEEKESCMQGKDVKRQKLDGSPQKQMKTDQQLLSMEEDSSSSGPLERRSDVTEEKESRMNLEKGKKVESPKCDLMDEQEKEEDQFEIMKSEIARKRIPYNVQLDEKEEDIDYGPGTDDDDAILDDEGECDGTCDESRLEDKEDVMEFELSGDEGYYSEDNRHHIYKYAKSGIKYWVEFVGLCTPVLCVEVNGVPMAFSFFDKQPLPQELYDEETRGSGSFMTTKKMYDRVLREQLLGSAVLPLYKNKLPEDVKAKLANIAFAYFKADSGEDVEYTYARCIKIRSHAKPILGMHMIFTAHQKDVPSVGVLFSVHLVTAFDPPEVCSCRILGNIDKDSIFEGELQYDMTRVSLKPQIIACPACAQKIKYYKTRPRVCWDSE